MNEHLISILSQFPEVGTVQDIQPLTSGLINQTYKVVTPDADKPDYILQCVNHHIFTNVELLQHNIETVTAHLRKKLLAAGVKDIERKVLRFLPTRDGKTYFYDGDKYWRVCAYIPDSVTVDTVNKESAYLVGLKFGEFQAMLADLPEALEETIPNFHNMEFRLQQLRDAVAQDKAGRLEKVKDLVASIEEDAHRMTLAERLYREGKLPKRVCHCDTKTSNMLFDKEGNVLCVIDLDTVMSSFICSDVGDFLRSAANTGKEDEKDLSKVEFDFEIFRYFIRGYLESAHVFLTPTEIELLPFAVQLFPYMQAVRFFTDYLNGDTYYRIEYPEHNYVRTLAQYKLYQATKAKAPEMRFAIADLTNALLKKG